MSLPATPLGMRQSRTRPPKRCAQCHKPIEQPTWNQRVHAGKCAEAWSLKATRKRRAAEAFKKERKRIGVIAGRKPERSPRYLAWIRSLPCVVTYASLYRTGQVWAMRGIAEFGTRSEAAHVGPIRGLRQKCSDYSAIPLRTEYHTEGPHSHHVLGKKFWAFHDIDRDSLIRELNARYKAEKGRAA